jgi:hypothetical protein
MITPEVVGRIGLACLAGPEDERKPGNRRAGLMMMFIMATLGNLLAAASRLSAVR